MRPLSIREAPRPRGTGVTTGSATAPHNRNKTLEKVKVQLYRSSFHRSLYGFHFAFGTRYKAKTSLSSDCAYVLFTAGIRYTVSRQVQGGTGNVCRMASRRMRNDVAASCGCGSCVHTYNNSPVFCVTHTPQNPGLGY